MVILLLTVWKVISNLLGIGSGIKVEHDAKQAPNGKIVGGTDSEKGEFKSIVSLRNKDGVHLCGGSILDATHILTAGHCCYTSGNFMLLRTATIGRYHVNNKEEGEQNIKIKKLILHKDYAQFTYDICIAKVSFITRW